MSAGFLFHVLFLLFRISRGKTRRSKSSVHICHYFYCKYSRRQRPAGSRNDCFSQLKVSMHKETDEVTVFQSLAHSNHFQKGGLTRLAKEIMRDKIRQHKSVAQIHDSLAVCLFLCFIYSFFVLPLQNIGSGPYTIDQN